MAKAIKAREDRQSLTVWISPETIKMTKIGALLDDISVQDFVEAALLAEIEKRDIANRTGNALKKASA